MFVITSTPPLFIDHQGWIIRSYYFKSTSRQLFITFSKMLVVTLAKWTMPNLRQLSKNDQKPYLQTISFSHYNEMARWSLSFAGISFVEHGYAPVQHVLPAIATRVGKTKDQNVLQDKSSTVIAVKSKSDADNKPGNKKKEGSSKLTSLPLLVQPDGKVLTDSWEITQWACKECGIQTAPETLCKVLDEEVGPGLVPNTFCSN